MTKFYEVSICGDCVEAAANGLDSFEHDQDFAQRFTAAGGILEPGHAHTLAECGAAVMNGEADCPFDEGGFSWSACDYCRSPLGGTRYPATVHYPKGKVPA